MWRGKRVDANTRTKNAPAALLAQGEALAANAPFCFVRAALQYYFLPPPLPTAKMQREGAKLARTAASLHANCSL